LISFKKSGWRLRRGAFSGSGLAFAGGSAYFIKEILPSGPAAGGIFREGAPALIFFEA
jgi:hypothetical protein